MPLSLTTRHTKRNILPISTGSKTLVRPIAEILAENNTRVLFRRDQHIVNSFNRNYPP